MFNSNLRRQQLDQMLAGRDFPVLKNGYISEIRQALGMSSSQLARRIGVGGSAVRNFEVNERKGNITISTLESCAAAMGCRLIYAFVPITTLDDVVREQALARAAELTTSVGRTMALEQQQTSSAAEKALLRDLADELRLKGGRELWS